MFGTHRDSSSHSGFTAKQAIKKSAGLKFLGHILPDLPNETSDVIMINVKYIHFSYI